MKLYRTVTGIVAEHDGGFFPLAEAWDELINHDNLTGYLRAIIPIAGARTSAVPYDSESRTPLAHRSAGREGRNPESRYLPPIGTQEVWAAGVTYFRSRTARMEESQEAGGGSFYDKVYQAERPELFFKSSPWRVRGSGERVRIRRDARWSVPEPELALVVSNRAEIVGYTIGNDMSSRDIEGENPLYLPQAKIYDGSCALGPAMLVREAAMPPDTVIAIAITRGGAEVFSGSTTLAQMRRSPEELVEFLYRETSFPNGCVLLTGTGVIPPDAFTLQSGDEIAITIEPIGTLTNMVE